MNHCYRNSLLVGAALVLTGCVSNPEMDRKLSTLEGQLSTAQADNSRLQGEVTELRSELGSRDSDIATSGQTSVNTATHSTKDYAKLPPNAKPGHCYARVLEPPQYATATKEMVVRPASERIEVTEPRYEWVEERIIVKEASKSARVIPAEHSWVEEQVLVKEASKELVTVPAQYETVSEQVLVRPAFSEWRKGRGPIEKIDNLTGEIMCLVEVPAEYKTVSKTVLVSPARTETRVIPAEYKTVRKRVMVSPPRMVEEEIPAEYETIKVRKLAQEAGEKRISIPAEYLTVQETRKVSDGSLEWREILCETNTTPDVVRKLQTALRREGFDPGKIDGVVGRDTMAAINAYQSDNGMPAGQLTLEMLNALNVL